MDFILILKVLSLILSTVLAVVALARLGKKKEHFQIFPDSIKQEYFKEVRIMTFMNIFAVILIFVSFLLLKSNLFFVISLASMFLSLNSIVQLSEDFDDLIDTKSEKKKKDKKK